MWLLKLLLSPPPTPHILWAELVKVLQLSATLSDVHPCRFIFHRTRYLTYVQNNKCSSTAPCSVSMSTEG